jgi:hypothetical protein
MEVNRPAVKVVIATLAIPPGTTGDAAWANGALTAPVAPCQSHWQCRETIVSHRFTSTPTWTDGEQGT